MYGEEMRLEPNRELEQFRLRVREFIAANSPGSKIHTGVRAPDDGFLPAIREWTRALYQAGFLGIDWPAEYGGRPDAHPLEQAIVSEELARARAWPPIGAGALAAGALIEYGTEEQRAHHLPRIRAGEDIWCQLFSEPGAGSDLASLQTRARRDGDEFVIDGQKVWTTNGQHADLGYLLARTSPDAPKHRGITAFILDMRSPGVEIRPLREITGTSDFNEVFFDAVRVPATATIGPVDAGWQVATASLVHERHGVGAFGVELFRMLADLIDLAAAAPVGDGVALDDPAVREQIGKLTANARVNLLLNGYTQSRVLAGREDPADAPVNKIFFSEANVETIELALKLQGNAALLTEADPAAVDHGWWQDAWLYMKTYTIAGGANEILRNLIAERSLGLPRDPAA
jgi:alkylation response protein AidB-like acyl-CoA dehydrogenase